MDQDELLVIEDFVVKMRSKINFLKDHISILELTEDRKKVAEETIAMLEGKLQKMIEAKNKKELKEVLRVKKLLKDKLHG